MSQLWTFNPVTDGMCLPFPLDDSICPFVLHRNRDALFKVPDLKRCKNDYLQTGGWLHVCVSFWSKGLVKYVSSRHSSSKLLFKCFGVARVEFVIDILNASSVTATYQWTMCWHTCNNSVEKLSLLNIIQEATASPSILVGCCDFFSHSAVVFWLGGPFGPSIIFTNVPEPH